MRINFSNSMHRIVTIVLTVAAMMLPTVTRADILCEYSFEGTLGDNIPVKLKFAVNGDEIAVEEILYLKAKEATPILVVVEMLSEENLCLREYQSDGTITGDMTFRVETFADGTFIREGTWTNPRTGKEFEMFLQTNEETVPIAEYFDYEDPQNIGREYAYSIWNPRYGAMMGGTAKFRGADKHKLHFDICNALGNIADGKSDPDRPAVLGNFTYDFFEYENVNDCGYGFGAYFFKRFVVLKTLTPADGCFGMGVAFDGVYMKIKQ